MYGPESDVINTPSFPNMNAFLLFILSRVRVTIHGVWIGEWISWTLTHDSELQVITTPPPISTIDKSPRHALNLFQPAVSSPAVP
jgi:hypothetical protein